MTADNDRQRQDEISRQRGYGETAKSDGKAPQNQKTRSAGFARDDENIDAPDSQNLVKAMTDERHSIVPDHAHADTGPAKSKAK